ncbi:MAG: hypothetical protein QXX41_08945 [Nitrososphaerota archaeon]
MKLDKEVIENLKKSRQIIGEIYPVIIEKDTGIVLAGRHRQEAGWESVKEIDIKNIVKALELPETEEAYELARILFMIHSNIQHKPSKDETKKLILQIAQLLEKIGAPKDRVSSILSKILPYSDRYIRDLLPEEYKMESKARFAELVPQIPTKPSEAAAEEVERVLSEAEEIAKAKKEIWMTECPFCHKHILLKCEAGKHVVED